MKMAVISDIHSNLVALQEVIKDIEKHKVDQIHCLGDTLGYGPHPLECLNLVIKICEKVLKGNHEDVVCCPYKEDELNPLACKGVQFSRSKLTRDIMCDISRFPIIAEFPEIGFVMCHGSFHKDPMWEYIDSPSKAKKELKHTPQKICLIGHTHSPFVFGSENGLYEYLPDNLELNPNEKYIINVGSVGQPRDGDCRSSYGIFDINDGKVSFSLRRVFYDIGKVEQEVRESGLPLEISERLYSGR